MPDLTDFGGGLYLPGEADSPNPQPGFAVPANALLQADNVEYLAGGGLRGRRGRRQLYAAPVAGAIVGVHRHYPRRGVRQFGPLTGTVAISVPAAGTAPWTNVVGVAGYGGLIPQYASCALGGNQTTEALRVTGFALGIPAGATVVGIAVEIVRRCRPNNQARDLSVRLLRGGLPVGENRADPETGWPSDMGMAFYGDAQDLWGMGWAPADFDATFGAEIIAFNVGGAQIPDIDTVRVAVWVTGADEAPTLLVAHEDPAAIGLVYAVGAGVALNAIAVVPPVAVRRPHFVTWPERNRTYIFDGVAAVREFDGNTQALNVLPANVDSLPVPGGPYAALWRSRLWATAPNELSFSVYGCEVNDPTSWLPDSQFSVNDPQGGTITGLLALPDRLLIFKDTCIFYFVGDILGTRQVYQFTDRGCIAPNTIALTPAGVIFLGRGGLYLTDGESPDPLDLSAPLSSLFNDRGRVRDFPNAVGVYYPTSNQYWLKLDPAALDGYVLQRTRQLDGSFRLAWAHMPVMPMHAATVLTGSSDEGQLYIGDTAGVVRQADVGALDDGVPILCEIATASITLDRSQRQGRICYVKTKARGVAGLDGGLRYDGLMADQLTFAVDGQPPVPAGVGLAAVPIFHHRRATITDMGIFGRSVAVRLRNPTDGPEFELHQITLDATMRSIQRWP